MGLVLEQVHFADAVPTVEDVAAAMAGISGLHVSVEHSEHVPGDDLHEYRAHLWFTGVERNQLTIFAYRPGAVRRHIEADSRRYAQDDPDLAAVQRRMMLRTVAGANETEGSRVVRLQMYMGQELTILQVAMLALETLGGRLENPPPIEERVQLSQPIPLPRLRQRLRRARKAGGLVVVAVVLMLPFYALALLWHMLFKFPAQARRARAWLDAEIERERQRRERGTRE